MNDIEILIRRVQSRLDAALSGEPFSVVHLSLEVKAIIAAYRARCAEAERDAARAEADGLRAKIEAQNASIDRYCGPPGRPTSVCGKDLRSTFECSTFPRRYIIELPERAKG